MTGFHSYRMFVFPVEIFCLVTAKLERYLFPSLSRLKYDINPVRTQIPNQMSKQKLRMYFGHNVHWAELRNKCKRYYDYFVML